jgi:hypothetical protein
MIENAFITAGRDKKLGVYGSATNVHVISQSVLESVSQNPDITALSRDLGPESATLENERKKRLTKLEKSLLPANVDDQEASLLSFCGRFAKSIQGASSFHIKRGGVICVDKDSKTGQHCDQRPGINTFPPGWAKSISSGNLYEGSDLTAEFSAIIAASYDKGTDVATDKVQAYSIEESIRKNYPYNFTTPGITTIKAELSRVHQAHKKGKKLLKRIDYKLPYCFLEIMTRLANEKYPFVAIEEDEKKFNSFRIGVNNR